MKRKNLEGKVFGRLTVLGIAPLGKWGARWDCLCECGAKKAVASRHLLYGTTLSCGCMQKERAIEASTTHGLRNTRFYTIHRNMQIL